MKNAWTEDKTQSISSTSHLQKLREDRAHARLLTQHAVTLQRFLRGARSREKTRKLRILEISSKLRDLEAVRLVFQGRGVVFVPPKKVVVRLMALCNRQEFFVRGDVEEGRDVRAKEKGQKVKNVERYERERSFENLEISKQESSVSEWVRTVVTEGKFFGVKQEEKKSKNSGELKGFEESKELGWMPGAEALHGEQSMGKKSIDRNSLNNLHELQVGPKDVRGREDELRESRGLIGLQTAKVFQTSKDTMVFKVKNEAGHDESASLLNSNRGEHVQPRTENKALWELPAESFLDMYRINTCINRLLAHNHDSAVLSLFLATANCNDESARKWIVEKMVTLAMHNGFAKYLTNKNRPIDDMVNLLIATQVASPAIPCFARAVFTIPNIISRISQPERICLELNWISTLDSIKTLTPSVSCDLAAVLGNLLNLLQIIPNSVFSNDDPKTIDKIFEILALLFDRVPENTYVGKDGVLWSAQRGVQSLSESMLAQLDITRLVPLLATKALVVDAILDVKYAQDDEETWNELSSALKLTVTTTKPNKRFNLVESFKTSILGSSWAAKLHSSTMAVKPPTLHSAASAFTSVPLSNTSSLARQLATSGSNELFSRPTAALFFFKAFSTYFTRWPANVRNPRTLSLLNTLAFYPAIPIIERAWRFAESKYLIRLITKATLTDEFWPSAFVTCILASHLFLVTSNVEVYERNVPMNRLLLEKSITKLNKTLSELEVLQSDQIDAATFQSQFQIQAVHYLGHLRDFHSRVPLTCSESSWVVFEESQGTAAGPTFSKSLSSAASSFFESFVTVTGGTIQRGPIKLSEAETKLSDRGAYWCIPFLRRAKVFQDFCLAERNAMQPAHEPPTFRLKVRRQNGGLDEAVPFFLKHNSTSLRKRIYVVYTNEFGLDEAGIDSRGLFKEFITTLAEAVFDPARGLFVPTADGDGALYPNPQARVAYGPKEAMQLFEFAGKLLGKALFEGIHIQPIFSLFILSKLLGKFVSMSELASLDRELYRNLLYLKTTQDDVESLCLTFALAPMSGAQTEIELFPGGAHTPVTSSNKYRYANLVAHQRLNVECKEEHDAFVRGFLNVVDGKWIRPFTEKELQILISGSTGQFNVEDFKQNTVYAGGYFASAPNVIWFWDVVMNDLDDNDRKLLLRFATSCTRAPLLGFASLEPRFTIRRVESERDSMLPTASTCFNTLKLPSYTSKQILKSKLVQAIRSNSGFDLS